MKRTYYVLAEDMASCLIGPFETYQAAEAHPRWGDGHQEIVSDVVAKYLQDAVDGTSTPEEDILAMNEIALERGV